MNKKQVELSALHRVKRAFMYSVGVFPLVMRLTRHSDDPRCSDLLDKATSLMNAADECLELIGDIIQDSDDGHEEILVPTRIYMMRDHHTGYTKIGRSKNPNAREQTLLSRTPSITLIWHRGGFTCDEKLLHRMYEAQRIRGEWFDLSDADVQHIMGMDWGSGKAVEDSHAG